MSNTGHCQNWERQVTQWAAGAADTDAATHVASCAGCARLASDLQAIDRALQALPVRQPSAMFEARLAGRLSVLEEAKRARPWWQKLSDSGRRAARPAMALGACAAALVGIVALEHPTQTYINSGATVQSAADKTLLLHCVEQHRTDVSAQPLSDPAAQNLAAQMDDAATGTSSDTSAGEDSL